MSTRTAFIGGSGFVELSQLKSWESQVVETPYGSAEVVEGQLEGQHVLFLLRHGPGHSKPPHAVNYRANIWALKHLGATRILAFNAVGGIRGDMAPGRIAVPNQIVDYTYGREHTFFTGEDAGLEHIDFTEPFTRVWRENIEKILTTGGFNPVVNAVYGCTQGPRLETAAEIKRMQSDGCDVVGMTAMPEAALAKELHLEYAGVAIIVNWAAGLGSEPITLERIFTVLNKKIKELQSILPQISKLA